MSSLFTQEQINLLRQHYPTHGSAYCAQLLSKSPKQITRKANSLGLRVTPERRQSARMGPKQGSPRSRLSVENFYPSKLTPVAAYVLGFLWADGYFHSKTNKIILEVTEKDGLALRDAFFSVGHWTTQTRRRVGRQPQMQFIATGKALFKHFVDLGYLTKSGSSPTVMLSQIPPTLSHHWHRGFFEGDGCFYHNSRNYCSQASFAGCYTQDWSFIEDLLHNMKIKHTIVRRKQGSYRSSIVRISKRENVIKLGDYLYPTKPEWGMIRKYEKYVAIKHGGLPHSQSEFLVIV